MFSIGQRIQAIADWSSFFGLHGTVTKTKPHLMVVFDDDPRPVRVGEREVVAVDEPVHMVAGD